MNGMPMGQGLRPEDRSRKYKLSRTVELTRWIFSRLTDAKRRVLLILLLCVLISLGNLAIPVMIGRAIDDVKVSDRLVVALALLAAVYVFTALLGWLQGKSVSRLAQKIGHALRGELYKHSLFLPVSYMDTHPRGDMMSRVTNDVESVVQAVSMVIPGLLSAVITIVGCTVIMLFMNTTIALINLGVGLAMALCGSLYSRLMFGVVRRQQQALGSLNAVVSESMANRHSVYAYGRQAEENRIMADASDAMERAGIRAQVLGAVVEPMMNVLGNVAFLATAILGGYLVISRSITLGVIQACLLYSRQLLKPLTELGMLLAQVQGSMACTDRIRELAEAVPEADDGTVNLTNAKIAGGIDFRDISFSYIRERKVLNGFSLSIRPRETVAIVGATGAGKTTLMNLLLRFYEPDSGTISIDGTDIRDIPRRRLHGCMAAILQDGSLMTDTVANNIAYGDPAASQEEIAGAAALVHADTFIRQLPEDYRTVIGQDESGSVLSDGQRQLVRLARIPLLDPRILIMDEATSAVDAHTEQLVQDALAEIRRGRTCIIIAHRLNTIRDADRIVMIDHGAIVEEGTHPELMRRKGRYYDLYMSGLSE